MGNSYRLHDLVLVFAKSKLRGSNKVESASSRQAQFLGRLDVLQGYAKDGEASKGFYALISLWRSIEELHMDKQLCEETYEASLQDLSNDESLETAFICQSLGRLLYLQVRAGTQIMDLPLMCEVSAAIGT